MFELPTDFRWLPPWQPIADESAMFGDRQLFAEFKALTQGSTAGTVGSTIVDELRREMTPQHRLANCSLRAIGFCAEDCDDILFTTDDDVAPLAVDHLTWRVEVEPTRPHTVVFHSLGDWISQMKRENRGVRWLTEDRE